MPKCSFCGKDYDIHSSLRSRLRRMQIINFKEVFVNA